MLGYANLTLMEGSLSERQVLFQNKITDTVRRMEMLVSDLADISRIESGQFFMNPIKVSVAEAAQAVKDTTANQIAERKHTYMEQIEADLPPIYIDYYRLVQVLTNFVSNAYKYTPDGGTITLSARKVDDKIEFSVADTGIGISPEAQKKLGTRFWRAEDDFTRSQPGTGLGFAITRSLVEQMGGRIEVESEVGKGSRFTFRIPMGAPPKAG
jgi:signal transduction histidine kinase